MKGRFIISLLLCVVMSHTQSASSLAFDELFGEEMILQRDMKINVWGRAEKNVRLSIEIQGQRVWTKADDHGEWLVQLSGLKAGGPFKLVLTSDTEKVVLNNVYVGEVWLAGGQSNMGWKLKNSMDGERYATEAHNENIRFLFVSQVVYKGDSADTALIWKPATGAAVGDMSAVAYFFARQLQEKLKVPIGIIGCYMGGSRAESWMNRQALLDNPETKPIVENYEKLLVGKSLKRQEEEYQAYLSDISDYRKNKGSRKKGISPPTVAMGPKNFRRPCGLYETMLQRIIPVTTRGTIFYQGEDNTPRGAQYRSLFTSLINGWRTDFRNPDMFFYFVQLSNYNVPNQRTLWAELRESQALVAKSVERTSMVVSIDVGEKDNIHFSRKEPIGLRLAGLALNNIYGISQVCNSPEFKSLTIEQDCIMLTFDDGGVGLTTKNNETLKGFEISGTDMHFVPAGAVIKAGKVEVSAEGILNPMFVRYGWANWTEANLCNAAGLPAIPFRTDYEILKTQGKLF